MTAMVFATMGWGAWWTFLILTRFAPEWAPSVQSTYIVGAVFAAVGLFFAIFTVRARLIWVLLAGVPIFANSSLLFLPPALGNMGVLGSEPEDG